MWRVCGISPNLPNHPKASEDISRMRSGMDQGQAGLLPQGAGSSGLFGLRFSGVWCVCVCVASAFGVVSLQGWP